MNFKKKTSIRNSDTNADLGYLLKRTKNEDLIESFYPDIIKLYYCKYLVFIALFLFLLVQVSCENTYSPRPFGYLRIDFPEKKYQKLDTLYPYSFEYPIYSKIVKDNSKTAEKYWANLVFPEFKATVHISYKDITGNLAGFEEDTRNMAYKHTIKADAINEKVWENKDKNVYGILYEIKGNTASSIQFYLTDSTKHFFRGALYFNVSPNKDSLQPSIEFIRTDIENLINTFEWNTSEEFTKKN